MADAVNSTTAAIIPFPAHAARAPDPLHRAIDDWSRTQNVALAACVFRGMNDGDAVTTVREMILDGGAESVAFMLEETGRAIKSMRHIVDELVGIDRLISAAADRVLAEAGR